MSRSPGHGYGTCVIPIGAQSKCTGDASRTSPANQTPARPWIESVVPAPESVGSERRNRGDLNNPRPPRATARSVNGSGPGQPSNGGSSGGIPDNGLSVPIRWLLNTASRWFVARALSSDTAMPESIHEKMFMVACPIWT